MRKGKSVICEHRNSYRFLCGLGSLGERICFPPRGDSSDVMSERQRGGAHMPARQDSAGGEVTPKGVIWDMDGVLVDTTPFHYQSWQKILNGIRNDFSWEEFASSFGMRNDLIIPKVFRKECTKEEIISIDAQKEAAFRKLAKGKLKPLEGLIDLLNLLKEDGFTMAVASSGTPENVAMVIKECNLMSFFSAFTNGSEVLHSKPDPEIFLLASKKLGVSPSQCVVVEDAPAGIQGAKSAGMKCIAITSTHKKHSLGKADIIVDRFEDLNPKVFNKLIGFVP
jgi:beta-phosphoglucomutase family hydrolase